MPKAAGAQNVLNLCNWNKAAVAKQLWALAKKDSLWIKWVNIYYMKGETVESCGIPRSAKWVIRKIIEARQIVMQAPAHHGSLLARLDLLTVGDKFSIGKLYTALLSQLPKDPGESITLQASIHPRHNFILWLALLKILATVDRLIKYGI